MTIPLSCPDRQMADAKQTGSGGGAAGAKEIPASEQGGSTLSITNVLLMREAESRGWKTRILNLKQVRIRERERANARTTRV